MIPRDKGTEIRNSVVISSDGSLIVSGSRQGYVFVWDFRTQKIIKGLRSRDLRGEVTSVAITRNNRFILGACSNIISIYDYKSETLTKVLSHETDIIGVVLTPDNHFVISATRGRIYIWNFETGTLLKKIQGHSFTIQSIAISPDGQHLISGDGSGVMLLWDLPSLLKPFQKDKAEQKEKEVAENWLFKVFCEITEDPSRLSVSIVQTALQKTNNLEEFRLSFTLANIAFKQFPEQKSTLQKSVFECLERLSVTCCVLPTASKIKEDDGPSAGGVRAEHKHIDKSKQASRNIAQYKLALDAALRKGFIDKGQQYYLDNQAEDHKTFSDERFVALERDVQALKARVEIAEHNIQVLSKSVNDLKAAFKARAQRGLLFSIAKTAAPFIAGPLIDVMAHIFDLSEVAELGAAILKTDVQHWHEWVEQGHDYARANMDKGIEVGLTKMGFDPEALVETWAEATLNLQAVAVTGPPSMGLVSGKDRPVAGVDLSPPPPLPLTPPPRLVAALVPSPISPLTTLTHAETTETELASEHKMSELKETDATRAFKEKLVVLLAHEDGGFKFLITRPSINNLLIRFTSADSILMDTETLKREFIALIKLLKQAISDIGIQAEHYKVEPNWKDWTLKIIAEPDVLNTIGRLLKNSGGKYLSAQADAVLFKVKSPGAGVTTSPTAAVESESQLEAGCSIQ